MVERPIASSRGNQIRLVLVVVVFGVLSWLAPRVPASPAWSLVFAPVVGMLAASVLGGFEPSGTRAAFVRRTLKPQTYVRPVLMSIWSPISWYAEREFPRPEDEASRAMAAAAGSVTCACWTAMTANGTPNAQWLAAPLLIPALQLSMWAAAGNMRAPRLVHDLPAPETPEEEVRRDAGWAYDRFGRFVHHPFDHKSADAALALWYLSLLGAATLVVSGQPRLPILLAGVPLCFVFAGHQGWARLRHGLTDFHDQTPGPGNTLNDFDPLTRLPPTD